MFSFSPVHWPWLRLHLAVRSGIISVAKHGVRPELIATDARVSQGDDQGASFQIHGHRVNTVINVSHTFVCRAFG